MISVEMVLFRTIIVWPYFDTVEPLYNGDFWDGYLVLYKEVVLFSEVKNVLV